MVFPLGVDDLQHDIALDALQHVAADELFLFVVRRDSLLPECVADFVGGPVAEIEIRRLERKHPGRLALQGVEVPLLEIGFTRREGLDQRVEEVFGQRHQIVARVDDLVLVNVNFALEDFPAQRVDVLALLVHHIVVLEEMFADREVLRLDLLLRSLDRAGDHPVLDRHPFFHAELLHEARDAIGPEDPHEIVFER